MFDIYIVLDHDNSQSRPGNRGFPLSISARDAAHAPDINRTRILFEGEHHFGGAIPSVRNHMCQIEVDETRLENATSLRHIPS